MVAAEKERQICSLLPAQEAKTQYLWGPWAGGAKPQAEIILNLLHTPFFSCSRIHSSPRNLPCSIFILEHRTRNIKACPLCHVSSIQIRYYFTYIFQFFCSKKLCFLYFYFCKFHPKLFFNYLSFWVFILLGLIRFYFKK